MYRNSMEDLFHTLNIHVIPPCIKIVRNIQKDVSYLILPKSKHTLNFKPNKNYKYEHMKIV